jgi:hypothetical protein
MERIIQRKSISADTILFSHIQIQCSCTPYTQQIVSVVYTVAIPFSHIRIQCSCTPYTQQIVSVGYTVAISFSHTQITSSPDRHLYGSVWGSPQPGPGLSCSGAINATCPLEI